MSQANSSRPQLLLLALLVTIIFAGGYYWFISTHKQVEETYTTPPDLEAFLNPYLAAERFLKKNGMQVKVISGHELFDNLPATYDTIFFTNHSQEGLLTLSRQDALHEWITEGGHLITIINSLWDDELNGSEDPFLDSYDIRQYRHDYSWEERDKIPPIETQFAGKGEALTINFTPEYYMVDGSENAYAGIETKGGYHLLQYTIESGLLTVLTDDIIWRNKHVGEHDHALFLHNLIAQSEVIDSEQPPTVWIVHELAFPSLISRIWKAAPHAVIAILVLLLFSLWAAYDRFGPPIIYNHRIRRSLTEHLDACGRYHWQQDYCQQLLTTIREQFEHLFEKHHAHWHELTHEQKNTWLAKRSGLSPIALDKAINHQPANEGEFTEIIKTLQRLRKSL